jgi:glyoxylase I family protein
MDDGRRMRITGVHHVTAICRDIDRTIAFYRDLLGLGIVRDGASDDDPGARHVWFGAMGGGAGRMVSFMHYPDMEAGSVGVGSTHHFALTVDSAEELEAWHGYLQAQGADPTEVLERGGYHSVYLHDPDGHVVEIATRGGPPEGARPAGVWPGAQPTASASRPTRTDGPSPRRSARVVRWRSVIEPTVLVSDICTAVRNRRQR